MANAWLSILVIGAIAVPQHSDLKEVIAREHGLSWRVPKAWIVKQSKEQLTLTFPVSGGLAKLSVFATYYRRPAEDWQKLQATIAEQLGRKLDRQWEEQVLGVPLLLTQTTSGSDVRTTGLLYAAVRSKFHFTLEAPIGGAGEAWEGWKEAMQTLRTLGEDLPSVEDGKKPLTPSTPVRPGSEPVRLAGTKPPPGIRLGSVRTETSAANRPVVLRTLKDWTLVADGDGFKLGHPKLAGKARLRVFNELDSPEASKAMSLWADLDLKRFQKVGSRVNTGPKRNEAGATTWSVQRVGATESGDLVTYGSVGQSGGVYWLLEYETDSPKSWVSDRSLIEKFVFTAGFEPPK